MSRTAQNNDFARLDASSVEQGIRNGRRLQAQAFGSVLKSLIFWKKTDARRDRAAGLVDCAATA